MLRTGLSVLLLCLLLVAGAVVARSGNGSKHLQLKTPEVVTLQADTFSYRLAGSFLKAKRPAGAPLTNITLLKPLSIMKYQVSAQDYALCLADGACKSPFRGRMNLNDQPVTGVSFADAQAYARWLSVLTGHVWRLPTDQEWVFAAGSRFVDDDLGEAASAADPSRRWLSKYAFDSAKQKSADSVSIGFEL